MAQNTEQARSFGSNTLRNDEDRSILQLEAERLLSKFSKHTPGRTSSRSTPTAVTHGHHALQVSTTTRTDTWFPSRSDGLLPIGSSSAASNRAPTPAIAHIRSSLNNTNDTSPYTIAPGTSHTLTPALNYAAPSNSPVSIPYYKPKPAIIDIKSDSSSSSLNSPIPTAIGSSSTGDNVLPSTEHRLVESISNNTRISTSDFTTDYMDSYSRRSSRSTARPQTYNVRENFRSMRELQEVILVDTPKPKVESQHSSRHASARPSHHTPVACSPQHASARPSEAPESVSSEAPVANSIPSDAGISRLLLDRSLGRNKRGIRHLQRSVISDLKPVKSWKSASNDIISLSWSPDSTQFSAGATAPADAYNRKNNFIMGDLVQNTLYELPDHCVRLECSSALDELVYTSVTATQWIGDRLYSASYDSTVKIWDVGLGRDEMDRPHCIQSLKHESSVLVMALPKGNPNIMATGTKKFSLWSLLEGERPTKQDLPIRRSGRQSNIVLDPTALAWGQTSWTSNVLIGGMSTSITNEYKVPERGHLQMWRICESDVDTIKLTPDSQNVFDIKWHPSLSIFATATAANVQMLLPRTMNSVVNIYEYSPGGEKKGMRFACPAKDINEITFCPMNNNYITASCTDGASYVWDMRYPTNAVHKLQHGRPLHPIDEVHSCEMTDFGVTLAQWGASADQFYTGSSDGLLKQWDIRLAPENALVANKASIEHGITSGLFSQDKTQLLVGDHGGGLWVFSSASGSNVKSTSGIKSTQFKFKSAAITTPAESEVAGVEASRELVASGELSIHPIFGAVQGDNYKGPYASWAREPHTPLELLRKTPLLPEHQVRQFDGPEWSNRHGIDETIMQELTNNLALATVRNRPRAVYYPVVDPAVGSIVGQVLSSALDPVIEPVPSTKIHSKPKPDNSSSVERKRKREISVSSTDIWAHEKLLAPPDQKIRPSLAQDPKPEPGKSRHKKPKSTNPTSTRGKCTGRAPGTGLIAYNDTEVVDLTGESPEPTLETLEERAQRIERLEKEAKAAKKKTKEEKLERRRKRKERRREKELRKEGISLSQDEDDYGWPANDSYDANLDYSD